MALLLPVVLIVTGTFLVLPGAVLARLAVRKPADERRDRPRGVILTSRPVLLAGLPLLVVGVPFLLAGAYQVAERGAQGAALETGGQRVDGTVLTKAIATERTRSRTSGTRSTTRHHRVTYRYRTLDGQQVVGTADLAPAAWGRLQERGPIGVVYLPQTPWLHRVDGEGDARIGFLVMATFGLISTAVGAVLLVIGLRRPRLTLPRIFAGTRRADVVPAPEPSPPALERPAPERRNWVAPVVGGVFLVAGVALLVSGIGQWIEERELSATGRLAEGHVVAKTIERAGSGDGARTRYLAAYRFETDDGEAFEGAYELAVDAWEALEAGAPVSVRYLPGDPGENRPANVSATGEIVVALLLGPVAAGIGGATLYFTLRRRLSAPHRN